MLSVKNLEKRYGSNHVLRSIDFQISAGTIYGFLGRNGAGKTTTMNILAGIIGFDKGEILFEGKEFRQNKREILQELGYVTQSPVFYDYMTPVEYLNFIATLTGFDPSATKVRIAEVLEFAGLSAEKKKKIKAFSGGMRQRFAIAVAIFNRPKLLILDEPTSSLDPQGRADILNFIKDLKTTGTTVFLSTHILNDIERVADEVSIIEKGKIIVSDNLNALKNKYLMPIIDIESTETFEPIKSKISELAGVKEVSINEGLMSVYIEHGDLSNDILRIIADTKFRIQSFNQRKSNLDDIFMRLINENI